MYADRPHSLTVVGELGTVAVSWLTDRCHRLRRTGRTRLTIDMSHVTSCHRAGLDGLLALTAGSAGVAVTVDGARWSQFAAVLSTTPDLRAPTGRLVDDGITDRPTDRLTDRPSPGPRAPGRHRRRTHRVARGRARP